MIFKQFFFVIFIVMCFPSLIFGMAQVAPCKKILDNLEKCTHSSCDYKHPLTGDMLKSEIHGLKNGKCHLTNAVPNGGKMECFYSESMRKAILQYAKDKKNDWQQTDPASVPVRMDIAGSKKVYNVDGKKIKNPIAESEKACKLTGFMDCQKHHSKYVTNLENCAPFSCKYKHPLFGGLLMEKKIIGFKNEKCHTTEEMPNNGRIECFYPNAIRKEIVKQMKSHLNPSRQAASNSPNLLQEAMDKGYCQVHGY